jgi:hypothetical protein
MCSGIFQPLIEDFVKEWIVKENSYIELEK